MYCTRGACRLQRNTTEIARPCCPRTTSRLPVIGYRFRSEMSLVERGSCGPEVALRTLPGGSRAERATPASALADTPSAPSELSMDEKRLSGAVMRGNHVAEGGAQGL